MNSIVSFRKCTLSNEELLDRVDSVGELIVRFHEQQKENVSGVWLPIEKEEGFINAMAKENDLLFLYDNGEVRRWMEENQPFAVSTHYMVIPKLLQQESNVNIDKKAENLEPDNDTIFNQSK